MREWSSCCRPNRNVERIERAFERVGKFGQPDGVVIEVIRAGFLVHDWQKRRLFKTATAAVRAAKEW